MTYDEAEVAVLRYLAEQGPNTYPHRFDIGAAVWKKTGGGLCAAVCGSLLTRKLIRRAPSAGVRDHRYGITDAGRLAVELLDLMEGAA